MNPRNWLIFRVNFILISLLTFFFSACGGGGGPTTELPPTTEGGIFLISGKGSNASGATLKGEDVNSSTLTGKVTYSNTEGLNFESTSISGVSVSGNTATITGVGKLKGTDVGDIPGFTFTVNVTDNPDTFSVEINESTGLHAVDNGDFSISGNRVYGQADYEIVTENGTFHSILTIDTDHKKIEERVRFYVPLTRLELTSTSLNSVSIGGNTAKITGKGKLMDSFTFNFTINVMTDSNSDTISIEANYSLSEQNVIEGGFSITGL